MRLQIVKSKNAQSLYVVKSVYHNKKRTNKVVEKLGTYEYLKNKLISEDPIEWAKKYVDDLNKIVNILYEEKKYGKRFRKRLKNRKFKKF